MIQKLASGFENIFALEKGIKNITNKPYVK